MESAILKVFNRGPGLWLGGRVCLSNMLEALGVIPNTPCKTKRREQRGKRRRGEKETILLGEISLIIFPDT